MLREVKKLAQYTMARRQQGNLDIGTSDPRVHLSLIYYYFFRVGGRGTEGEIENLKPTSR